MSTKTRLIIVASAILIVAVLVIVGAVTKAQTSQTNAQVVVLNLLNGQQYFGVPHVYQGDNGGTPTNQWPVYLGPNNASQYWSLAGISSNQPVLMMIVPYQEVSAGAMFWSETYSGGAVKITIIGTYSSGSSPLSDGFEIYLFLNPTMWGISPQYNYTIPYNSTAGEGWYDHTPPYPSLVEGDVILPQSSTPYIVVQWDPDWQITLQIGGVFGATGQWNVWIVNNPSGNNPSINPSSSPNLGSSFAGWDGIGTGAFQPNPGDLIVITVTYDPSTNTLSGVATDLNTGQSASFTLNLGNYFTPPNSGNYVFGIAGNTGVGYTDWALLYVATTQQTTTPPSPSLSSLVVRVFNVLGRPATTVPGVVFGVLYNSSGFSEVAFMNSSGFLNFNNISPGTYTLKVYHYPNTGLNLIEYWGGMTVSLQSGSNFVTFIRHEPWIYNLQSSASNGSIVVTVTVNGTVTSPTPGEIELWVANNPSLASPYNPSKVINVTINPGLNTFNLTYPASQAGTYYVYAAVLTYINTYTVTDQWGWTATTIIQPPTPPTLPQNYQNYQVVLNLLNGQQYFGVPHVYQGDNGGTPTNQWPVYLGPNNASQYWSQGNITSNQPVLELVPGPMSGGAMFWSETYSGGSITITIQATASIVVGGTPFQVYLFLKPTMWGISPQYNYTIPYESIYPWPVGGDVISPQSSTSYLIIQWAPVWQPAAGVTGQWNVGIVSNPSGNNASVGPYPSPNLGDEGVGWEGIGTVGTGFIYPNPGDQINVTVTYDPSTNTLNGVAVDLNTGQSASFTLNLSGYFTPPSSGNYVFGVGAATFDLYGGNGALLYVAMMGNVKSPLPSPTYYSVNFTEVGLPPGTAWNVTLNGVTKASSNSSIIFTVPNGEYKYSVASPILVNGVEYVATKPSGTVTVNNANMTVIVQYVPITALLVVQVFNVLGRPATTVPGVVLGVLYNSSGFKEAAYMNSSGYLNFYGVSPGTYILEVYHYPNTGLNLTEYWGSETINVQPGYNTATFYRHEPWIYNLQAVENGARITINVTVDDPLNAILHGELYIWVTTSPQTANPSEPTIDTSLTSITIRPGLNKFTYYYTATQEGTYYIYAALLIYNGTQLITTDQWNWTAVPKMSAVPKTYQLTVIIINPYGASGTWQFKLYKSNNYFQQGQIVGTQSITFQQGQTNTMFSFDLTPGVYEYIIKIPTSELKYIVMPNIKGFINVTHNEVIYLYIISTTSPSSSVLYLIPIGLSDTSQWYVVWNGTIILTPGENGEIYLFVDSNEISTIDLEVYSTNPQYHPLLPIVQLNASSLSLIKAATYAVPFVAAGYPAYIVDWNGVQWNPLLNEYSQRNFDYAYNNQIQDGFCWGMSSTAILYYLGYLPLPSQGASYTSQLYLGPINGKGYLEYLTDASLAVAVHEILDPLNHVIIYKILNKLSLDPASEIASFAINHIDNNQPVILIIHFTNQNGNSKYVGSGYHAVVAWGYVKEPNGDVVFLVYDPNYPQIITRAIYNPTDGSFIYIDGHPQYLVIVNGQEFSYPGDVGEVIGVASPTPANLLWFNPVKGFVPLSLFLTVGPLLDYTLYVSMIPLNVYTGGELVGYFIDNRYFVTASTVQPGELAGYVDGYPWPPLYIVAVRNDFNAWVDPNSTLVALRFANASGTIMVYGFVVNTTEPVAIRFVNQSSFIVASRNNTVVKLELFSVTNSSVKTYNTTLWLSNRTGYVVSANFTNLTNTTIKTVTVSWGNITPTQTATATTTTTSSASTSTSISTGTITTATTTTSSSISSVTTPTTSSTSTKPTHGATPTWVTAAVVVIVVVMLIIALLMSRRGSR